MVFVNGVFESFVGDHAVSVGRPGSPGSDGASPYPLALLYPLAAIVVHGSDGAAPNQPEIGIDY
jgi:hypothetical protein